MSYSMKKNRLGWQKGLLGIVALALMLAALLGAPSSALAAGGDGTAADPWIITTAAELDTVRNYLDTGNADKCFKLGNDIDLTAYLSPGSPGYNGGLGWEPIGTSSTPFTGSFDGAGHQITGLWINRSTTDYVGLFGAIRGTTAVIKDLSVEMDDSKGGVKGGLYVGGLVGQQQGGSITSCYATGSVNGSGDYVGGLVGYQGGGSITSCYATGGVTGSYNYVGGLVGYQGGGSITSCYATGSVTGGYNYVGGLVGYQGGGSITSCYATGSVTGSNVVGALVGWRSDSITTSYYDNAVNALPGVGYGSTTGVTGLTTAQMTASGTLTGVMSGLGTANWSKRTDGTSCCGAVTYYPELTVFFGAADNLTQEMSQISVIATTAIPVHANETPFLHETGVAGDPYQIKTVKQLNHVRSHLGASHRLMTDLSLSGFNPNDDLTGASGLGWQPIGTSSTPFTGSFDGAGHKITGLWINRAAGNVGLFGVMDGTTAVIKDLGVEMDDSKGGVKGVGSVGGLVGQQQGGSITSCYATGSVTGSGNYVGGLVGNQQGGSITSCTATGSVTGNSQVGGLVGWQSSGSITSCYATGSVTGGSIGGGLVGYQNGGSITSCYATGSVTGSNYVGGLVGNQQGGSITSCYATGSVTGSYAVGGLVGVQINGSIESCYATGSVTGSNDVGGLVGYQGGGNIIGCYYNNTVNSTLPGVGSNPTATGVTGRSTLDMIAPDTLTNAMSGLGIVNWSKRAADSTHCYYPELTVFYGGTAAQQAASKESVRVARVLQTVGPITAPAPVMAGQPLALTPPVVTPGLEAIVTERWELSADGSSGWAEYTPGDPLYAGQTGYFLRYYTLSDAGAEVCSNTVQITVGVVNHDCTQGNGQTLDGTADAVFRFNGDLANLIGVSVDGNALTLTPNGGILELGIGSQMAGKAESGSVIITLYGSYLRTLANGNHTVTLTFLDNGVQGTGSAGFTLTARAPSPLPRTGDNSNITLWLLMLAALCGAGVLLFVSRKKKKKEPADKE